MHCLTYRIYVNLVIIDAVPKVLLCTCTVRKYRNTGIPRCHVGFLHISKVLLG